MTNTATPGTPETPYEYKLTTEAATFDEALIAFHEAFDDEENYTEFVRFNRIDEDTVAVVFLAEKPINTASEPNVQ